MIIPWVAPYLLGLIHIALTGSVYTTIAVAMERCVTVCAPFTDVKVQYIPVLVNTSFSPLPGYMLNPHVYYLENAKRSNFCSI
jgi:hypothetical protein